jgi:membrane fusion protein (multidrug efflux system)
MSKKKKLNTPVKVIIFSFLVVVAYIFVTFIFRQFQEEAVTTVVKKGTIRDSVSGNVRVLAGLSYQLRSETQSQIVYAALIPNGKPIKVDENQTIFLMDTVDLNRSLNLTLLRKESHEKRLKVGSSVALQLEVEEKNLKAYRTLKQENSNDVASFELDKKVSLVERLRKSYEFEIISNSEASEAFKLEIDRLQDELGKRVIRSPISGNMVTSNVKKGDTIFGGQILGEIQSKDRIVEVTLNEEDFAGVKEGQKVGVTLFSFGNQIFEGTVTRISANVNPQTGRRKIFVNLETKQDLPVGASGRAEIIKAEKENSLILPTKALLGSSVFAVKDGKAHQIKLQIGARNLEFVEVIKGLKANDRVITETPHLFHDGQSIISTMLK